jgi:hypothetical protein
MSSQTAFGIVLFLLGIMLGMHIILSLIQYIGIVAMNQLNSAFDTIHNSQPEEISHVDETTKVS